MKEEHKHVPWFKDISYKKGLFIDGTSLNCEVDSWCFGELEQPILRFEFTQINVLVTANREDDRLNTKSKDCNVEFDVINRYQDKQRLPVEIHIVDTA